MKSFVKLSALALTALSPVAVYAQEAPADESGVSGNDIVVTARKTEERLQDAPTTVAVATAATIDRLGLDSLADIAKTTPGLVFDDSFGRDANRPVIRGQANILGLSGVAYFIDGIYYSGSLADYDVDTIERLEVVKGPQSALYGRNTYSGAINLISKRPGDKWEGRVQADISENDRYELTANVRGPITKGVGIALGGRVFDNKGEFRNALDGTRLGKQRTYSGYALVQYDDGGPFTASLRGNVNDTDDGQPAIFATDPNASNCFPDNGNVYAGRGRYFCGVIKPQPVFSDYLQSFVDPENVGLEVRTVNAAFRADYDFSETFTLTSLTGYNKRFGTNKVDADYVGNSFFTAKLAVVAQGPAPAPTVPPRTLRFGSVANQFLDFVNSNAFETEDWSQEVRLAYQGDRVQLLLGGYYFDQSDDTRDTRVLPANAVALLQANTNAGIVAQCAAIATCGIFNPITVSAANLPLSRNVNNLDIRNKAVFGSATFDITDTLSLSAEGRYAGEKVTQTTFTFNAGAAVPAPRIVSKTFKEFTPRFTLSFKPAADHLLYGVYAEGQKPGGFNSNQGITAGFPTFDPEDNKTFEIGSKNSFLDGQLVANLALYTTKVTGYQITQNVATVTNQVSITRNGGNARIKGAEFELSLRPDRHVTVTANYSYVDAKFTFGSDENLGLLLDLADDRLNNCSTGRQFPALNCSSTNATFGSIVGKRIPRAPAHTAFVDLDYRTPIGDSDWSLFAGANVSMVSSSFAQVLNFAKTGGSAVVDLRAGVQNDRFKIQAYVKNATDEDSVQQIIRYADASNDLRRNFIAGLRPGRRFGVVFTAQY